MSPSWASSSLALGQWGKNDLGQALDVCTSWKDGEGVPVFTGCHNFVHLLHITGSFLCYKYWAGWQNAIKWAGASVMYALVEPLHVYLLNGPAVLQGLTCVLILPRGKIYDSPFERRNFFLLPRGRKQVHRARKNFCYKWQKALYCCFAHYHAWGKKVVLKSFGAVKITAWTFLVDGVF